MSLETMTKLASTTVGVGGTAAISFSNIPQGYTDLKIIVSARNTTNTLDCTITFNSSTTGYTRRDLYGNGSSATTTSASDQYVIWLSQNSDTASTFGNAEIYIPNYSGFNYKSFHSDSVTENNATQAYQFLHAGLWSNSSPITSITLTSGSSFAQHSTFTLYGIKNMRQSAGNSIKATGGNIVFDGTYVYHVFNSTGAFVPTQSFTADALVIAGGGSGAAGGNSGGAGGGGAGGLLTFANQSFATGITYTATVGAGGAAVTTTGGSAVNGNTGNDSQLGSLTTVKGGGYGGGGLLDGVGSNGGPGGSGGGAGRWSNSAGFSGGAATAGQGNAGGGSTTTGGGRGSGGGGGAGAAGTTGVNTSNNDGAGGSGITLASIGLSSLSIGVNGYIAGGGGGSSVYTANGLAGAGGGGAGPQATGSAQTSNSGTPNTGGGGGGMGGGDAAVSKTSGAGGSGIIVIKYKA